MLWFTGFDPAIEELCGKGDRAETECELYGTVLYTPSATYIRATARNIQVFNILKFTHPTAQGKAHILYKYTQNPGIFTFRSVHILARGPQPWHHGTIEPVHIYLFGHKTHSP